jgi:uncharacterized protein YbcV (DUF1398 family)
MDTQIKNIVEECSAGSEEGRLTFPQVVMKLSEAGIERYNVDLVRHEKIFYMPDGLSYRIESHLIPTGPAQAFNKDGIVSAIRESQAQKIDYKTFCQKIADFGCVSYLVSLAGRRAVYFGRRGDSHVELFPDAI